LIFEGEKRKTMLRKVVPLTLLFLVGCSSATDSQLSPEERASYGDGSTLNHRLTTTDWLPRGSPVVHARPGERWGVHPAAHDIRADIVLAPAVLRFQVWQARIGERARVSGRYRYRSPDLSVWAAWRVRGNVRLHVPSVFLRPIQVERVRGWPVSGRSWVTCYLRPGTESYPEPIYQVCRFEE